MSEREQVPTAWHLCWGDGPVTVSWEAPCRRSVAEGVGEGGVQHRFSAVASAEELGSARGSAEDWDPARDSAEA